MSEPPAPVAYKDRSTGMVLFGIVELLIALGCLGMLALTTVALTLPGAAPKGALLPGLSVYLLLGVLFSWLGVGSILPRRWARPLSLIVAWLGLLAGVVSLAVFLFVMPGVFERLAKLQAGKMPGGGPEMAQAMMVAQGCAFAAIGVCFVLVPALLIAFYGGRNVKATFEARDPVPRWTDTCPTPVLALSLLLAYSAFGTATAAAGGTLPILGQAMSGLPAVALTLAIAGMLAVLSRATYKLEPWSWWAVGGFWVLWALSGLSFATGTFDWKTMYQHMEMPAEQIREIEQLGLFESLNSPAFKGIVLLLAAGSLGYLLWVRRFFRPQPPPAAEA